MSKIHNIIFGALVLSGAAVLAATFAIGAAVLAAPFVALAPAPAAPPAGQVQMVSEQAYPEGTDSGGSPMEFREAVHNPHDMGASAPTLIP
jgi:hypothetical protein